MLTLCTDFSKPLFEECINGYNCKIAFEYKLWVQATNICHKFLNQIKHNQVYLECNRTIHFLYYMIKIKLFKTTNWYSGSLKF